MDPLEHIPSTLLRPLPVNATFDAKLRDQIDRLCQKLPDSMEQVAALLEPVVVVAPEIQGTASLAKPVPVIDRRSWFHFCVVYPASTSRL